MESDCGEFLGNKGADPSTNHSSERVNFIRKVIFPLSIIPLGSPFKKQIQGIPLDLVNIINLAK